MNRFTEKRKNPLTTKWEDVPTSYYRVKGDDGVLLSEIERLNKLGGLEDLEEQIGCPLEIRERALKQCEYKGLYFETEDTDGLVREGMYKCMLSYDGFNKKFYWATGWNAETWLNCYKKTWWLKKDKSE